MKDLIFFVVDGKPIPKARPRVTKRGITFTPEATRRYEQKVRDAWKKQDGEKIEGIVPLTVNIIAYFPIPDSLSKKKKEELEETSHTKRGDCDNIAKSILDALNGYAFNDDAQVSTLHVRKVYSKNPRVTVSIVVENENREK